MGSVPYDDRRRLASPAASYLQLPGQKHEIVERLAAVAAGSRVYLFIATVVVDGEPLVVQRGKLAVAK
jgi:hypothetical protein